MSSVSFWAVFDSENPEARYNTSPGPLTVESKTHWYFTSNIPDFSMDTLREMTNEWSDLGIVLTDETQAQINDPESPLCDLEVKIPKLYKAEKRLEYHKEHGFTWEMLSFFTLILAVAVAAASIFAWFSFVGLPLIALLIIGLINIVPISLAATILSFLWVARCEFHLYSLETLTAEVEKEKPTADSIAALDEIFTLKNQVLLENKIAELAEEIDSLESDPPEDSEDSSSHLESLKEQHKKYTESLTQFNAYQTELTKARCVDV